MPQFFCVSDIHGYYNEFVQALLAAEFDRNNEDHWLICCGDCFDRGVQPMEVMEYLTSLPRKFLIRGNHEDLIEECYTRQHPLIHDFFNGTALTITKMGKNASLQSFEESSILAANRFRPFFDNMVDFFETKNYIFVHGWIPTTAHSDWRKASPEDWRKARWKNGMQCAHEGHTDPNGKTIVCGHIRTSWGHHHLEDPGCEDEYENGDFSPFFATGIIAIDACTAYSKRVNVVILEDDFANSK